MRRLNGREPKQFRQLGMPLALLISWLCQLACATVTPGERFNCAAELTAIQDGDFCSLILAEQLEQRVIKYKKRCIGLTRQTKQILGEKLADSSLCAENERMLNATQLRCKQEMHEADIGMDCIGKECIAYREYIEGVVEKCNDPGLGGVYEAEGERLVQRIKARRKSAGALRNFASLADTCMEALGRITADNANFMLDNTIKIIKKKGRIGADYSERNELAQSRAMALASCEQNLKIALEILTDKYRSKLRSNRMKLNPKKWKQTYKKLKVIRARVHKLNAETFFPAALEVLDTTIDEFDPENSGAAN